MKYLLDSNVLSEPTKPKPDPAVIAWLDANESECAVSSISLAELRYGIERLPEGKRRNQLEREFAFLRQDSCGYFARPRSLDWVKATRWRTSGESPTSDSMRARALAVVRPERKRTL